MSRTAMKQVARADNMPDLEDWWGDFDINVPPPAIKKPKFRVYDNPNYGKSTRNTKPRSTRKNKSRRKKNKVAIYCVVALIATMAFLQLNRLAEISLKSKQISRLNDEIKKINENYETNVLHLSMAQNINKVREDAIYKLGMEYATEDQIHVVTLPEYYSDTVANNADKSGTGEVAP